MGAPAIMTPQQPSGTPETPQAPSAAPSAPAPSQTPTPGDGAAPASSTAPAGAPSQPATPGTPAASRPGAEAGVPYPKFREVRGQLAKATQQYQTERQGWQSEQTKLQGQIKSMEADMEPLREVYDALNEHPDLLEQLIQRVQGGVGGVRPGGAARRPAAPPVATLPPELTQTVQAMQAFLKNQQNQHLQAQQRAADQETGEKLNGILTGIITERGYDPEFLGDLREFVLQRVAASRDPVDLEDVPYIAADWIRRMEAFHDKRLNKFREGKVSDAQLPVSPGPTATPVTTAAAQINDPFGKEAKQKLVAGLEAMGWGRQG